MSETITFYLGIGFIVTFLVLYSLMRWKLYRIVSDPLRDTALRVVVSFYIAGVLYLLACALVVSS